MPHLSKFRSFEALDTCHQQIQQHLDELATLINHAKACHALDDATRKMADSIEIFFSTVARGHHAAEEQDVFPCLLSSGKSETVVLVRDLIEDHFWIEKFWLDLSPVLREIAEGGQIDDVAKFEKTAGTFFELCSQHIAVEEAMIYPDAKKMLLNT